MKGGRKFPMLDVRCWLFLLSLALAPALFAAPPAGYYLAWSDEFNNPTLDSTKWDYWLLGSRRQAVNVTNAVSLNGSNLVITTYTTNSTHYTGMIATDGTFRSRYGYWESSIKWSDSNGMWSAWWMQSPTMGTYLYDPFVSGSEIDIVEHRYVDGSTNYIGGLVQNNIHWNGYGSAARSAGSGNIGSGLTNGFHTYGFLWTPAVYTLYVDGSNLRSWNYANNGVPVSQSTEWVILSSEVDNASTTWAGYIPAGGYGNLGASAAKMIVDYVRYYAPTTTIFWTGASSLYWTNAANFVSNLPPLATSDVTFSYLSGNNLSNILGQDYTVNGLVFLHMNNGASVNGPHTLTLGTNGIDMVAANHTVTIYCPVNIGATQTWLVGPNSPGNTLILNGNLSGSASLSKGGYGTLILNGTNSFSGTLNVDTGSTANNDGALRVTRGANLASVASPIAIRNNNSGSSTLQLDGSPGDIAVAQNITLNGRNTNVVAIQNLSGSNTLAGGLSINVGGGLYLLQSDAGTLNLGGVITSVASGTRNLTFQGGGNFYVAGSMQNGSATTLNLSKTNAGTLTLAGANTFSGATTNWRGNLLVNGSLASSLAVAGGTLAGTGTIAGAAAVLAGGTLAPGISGIGTLSFGSGLTLAAGSTNVMELNRTAKTNDLLKVAGALTYGGNLVVMNLSGTLMAGDSFKLFSAGGYSGAFASLSPAAPGPGLVWNTNTLATDGTLRIAAAAAPVINSVIIADNRFQLSITNGPAYSPFRVFTSTNLALPVTNWTPVWTDAFSVYGIGQFTSAAGPTNHQQFFNVTVP
jgi:autotransporter-associated beta strand protein